MEITAQSRPVPILGGAGKTGRRVARHLSALGLGVRPVSRSTRTPFDGEEPTTWRAALDGVQAAYLAFQPDLAVPGEDQTIGRVAAPFGRAVGGAA